MRREKANETRKKIKMERAEEDAAKNKMSTKEEKNGETKSDGGGKEKSEGGRNDQQTVDATSADELVDIKSVEKQMREDEEEMEKLRELLLAAIFAPDETPTDGANDS